MCLSNSGMEGDSPIAIPESWQLGHNHLLRFAQRYAEV